MNIRVVVREYAIIVYNDHVVTQITFTWSALVVALLNIFKC